MRVWISGGAGYLGSILTDRLLQEGHRVTVLDSLRHGRTSLDHICHHPHLRIIRGDCRERQNLTAYDVIIPLAALVGVDECKRDTIAATSTNLTAIQVLCADLSKDQMVLFPNTNSGYGTRQDGLCLEGDTLMPISLYGRTKAGAEKIVMERQNSLTFRFATLFGMSTRMRWELLVNDFTRRAAKDRALVLFEPEFKRNFLSVRDAAGAFAHALANWDKMKGQVYNAGLSSANLTKRQLAEKIKEFVPDLHILEAAGGQDPDKRNYIVSNAKLEATGWKPRYSLDDGIKEVMKGCVYG